MYQAVVVTKAENGAQVGGHMQTGVQGLKCDGTSCW